MALSAFDLYTVGIGPSSSHTVGPMRAAKRFADGLTGEGRLPELVHVELFGSLGATGHGHGSENAVLLGLLGEDPATVDTRTAEARAARVRERGAVTLNGVHETGVEVVLHRRKSLPVHPNGMMFTARGAGGEVLRERTYYSVGGGFVVDEQAAGADRIVADTTPVRYPFATAADLLRICADRGLRISDVMLANELAGRTERQVRDGLLHIWGVMAGCVRAGCQGEGVLPGGLRVPRRARPVPRTHVRQGARDPLDVVDWVTLFALAVNEENAAGGRVVTAPTNGAAGIIPAVLHYYTRFEADAGDDGVVRFLLAAAAIGILVKQNASISGAEVGCQGEVGSACSMAAAGLCEVLGGSPR
ncbi:L-serine dehydratase [Amycolatopsis thermophila]|uniref:L-serine dehydratase n=1 Tax=Amycolatopsis thermophila TaxID=206084 RepID=A0ABU0EM55_9PSEU|nr:L-serine dehydratase [Amycolatopsis thermophila]